MRPEVAGAGAPVRLAIAEDAPVVRAGVEAMVAGVDGFRFVALPSTPVELTQVDVVLYDPSRGVPPGFSPSAPRPLPALVAFSWSVRTDVATRARGQGAVALLSKDLPADRLLNAVRAVHRGDAVRFTVSVDDSGARLRRPDGLTQREVEMLDLITRGLSNEEIASSLYLSINSVKTYIRTAYRKIGVTRRPQAVLWGVHHGFGADGDGGVSSAP